MPRKLKHSSLSTRLLRVRLEREEIRNMMLRQQVETAAERDRQQVDAELISLRDVYDTQMQYFEKLELKRNIRIMYQSLREQEQALDMDYRV